MRRTPGPYIPRFAARKRKKTGGTVMSRVIELDEERYSGSPGLSSRRQRIGWLFRNRTNRLARDVRPAGPGEGIAGGRGPALAKGRT
jgi:hypothetical protein